MQLLILIHIHIAFILPITCLIDRESFHLKNLRSYNSSFINTIKLYRNSNDKSHLPSHNTDSPFKILSQNDKITCSDDAECIINELENLEGLSGPYISREGEVINKKRKLYSTGELRHVDDFFVGKFHVEWTVRGVMEKLQYRRRDTKPVPLRTSRFTFAGIGGFILKLWLDGHEGSQDGFIALNLIQQEHWTTLESPICLYAGNIVRGPFFYRSREYIKATISFCRLDEVVEDNTLRVGVKIAER